MIHLCRKLCDIWGRGGGVKTKCHNDIIFIIILLSSGFVAKKIVFSFFGIMTISGVKIMSINLKIAV